MKDYTVARSAGSDERSDGSDLAATSGADADDLL
jgi:hypothetical protein